MQFIISYFRRPSAWKSFLALSGHNPLKNLVRVYPSSLHQNVNRVFNMVTGDYEFSALKSVWEPLLAGEIFATLFPESKHGMCLDDLIYFMQLEM
jgi:hypothetical protein